jgi:hypothetical protein
VYVGVAAAVATQSIHMNADTKTNNTSQSSEGVIMNLTGHHEARRRFGWLVSLITLTTLLLAGCAPLARSSGSSGMGPGGMGSGGTGWGTGAFASNGERIYFTATSERGTNKAAR